MIGLGSLNEGASFPTGRDIDSSEQWIDIYFYFWGQYILRFYFIIMESRDPNGLK